MGKGQTAQSSLRLSVRQTLDTLPLLHGLTEEHVVQLEAAARLQTVPAKTNIIRRESPNVSLYCLLSGTVRICLQRENQREIVLNVLGKGAILGDISTLDGGPASATVTTLEESRFLIMARIEFLKCLQRTPQVALNVIALQNIRMRRLTDHTEALATLSTESRLIRQLLLFVNDYGVPAPPADIEKYGRVPRIQSSRDAIRIPLRLTQGDLAALCSCSIKQINRAMTELQRKRLVAIEQGHRILVLAPNDLRALCPYAV